MSISRREFLRNTSFTGAALAGLAAGGASTADDRPGVPRRKLGQTDLEVSAVGYGTEFMNDQAFVEHLIDEGVTYLDTAVLYQEGNAERMLAPILASRRDEVVVGTKWTRTIPPDAPKQAFLDDFAGSLDRMAVESVDIIYMHDRRTPESVACAGAKQAFDQLKSEGKVRYLGMSSHVGRAAAVAKGVELGWFDVMQIAHNFLSPATDVDALKAAADAGVGVLVMKTCKALSAGADWYPRATDEQRAVLGEANLFQAAIKWSLGRDYVTGIVLAMGNYDEASEDLAAAREAMTPEEARALEAFTEHAYASICRGCGSCDEACPRELAVSDVLRYRSYAEGYGQTEIAARMYRSLPAHQTAAACTDCGSCEAACPYGLPIRAELRRAHGLMA
ncbi:MAG TPA: aldo/keto reductase [Armatimonadota bacterium]|nr:aldo/keto reductase [Armatimonadota bacterium]